MAPMRRPIRQAFTLIELLVVIAIIAILTAILLPVFASVREGARQGTSISNMKDIQQKMAQFKLDNHRYPDVLFGYAYPGTAMKNGLAQAQIDHQNDLNHNVTDPAVLASHNPAIYFPGLYPAYIKDPEVFTDPNNTVNSSDTGKIASGLAANLVAPCNAINDAALSGNASACSAIAGGSIASTTRSFYMADAYDSSPTVVGTNQINDPTANASYLVRYQIAREGTFCAGTNSPVGCDPNVVNDAIYRDQLRWQNPPAETLITVTTYHVKNADKVLAIFESGAVKKITGHDFAALESSGYTPTFWKVANWPANIKP